MGTCEFCGAAQLHNAFFCGNCGRTASSLPEAPTSGSGLPSVKMNTMGAADTIKASQWEYAPQNLPSQAYSTRAVPNNNWQPLNSEEDEKDEEDEEEKRRRAALLGIGLIGFAGDMQQQGGTVPMVQGNPQFGGVPFVQGTPGTMPRSFANNAAQGSYPAALHSSPTMQAPPFGRTPMPPSSIRPGTPHRPNKPPAQPSGCAPVWLIFLFAIILIISGIVTIGLTVLSPSLSTLSGNTDVTIGNTLQLHGNSFIPGSSVVLTLDNTVPLFYTERAAPLHALYGINSVVGLSKNAFTPARANTSSNVVSVGLDGSFIVTIAIDASWHTGQHSIRAAEKFTPRNAVITINVQASGQTLTPTPSATVSPSPTATVSPSATVSTTATTADLSCVNPTSVALGPVSEGYTQAVSSQVSLCTAGTGTVHWTATWDQNAASWLQLDQSSGQIQAPAQQQITVSALATNLKAGSYTATITFSNAQSSTAETVNVTFTVQAACITASQKTLSFTGVAGVSDPQAQTLTVANCGLLVGTWATIVTTANNVNWLSTTPTRGSLNDKATQSVTITASNLKTLLNAGTYSGSIIFSMGTNQVVVSVTLTVQAGPKIVVVVPNPPSFNADAQCAFTQSLNVWTCIASISNSSQTQSLTWQSSSTGVANITFKPASGTLAPSGGTRVIIIVPKNDCQTATTLTFTGPANSQNIAWGCTIIQ
ncbi:MAG: hypothetical protein ABI396_15685 [Ktedonobacteraceae bacterium]